jgi:hypothetical protein
MPRDGSREELSFPQKRISDGLDEVAKGLAAGTISRRKALRLIGGTLVGGALASIPGVAWAQGRPCPKGTHPCSDGSCVPLGTLCGPAVCPPGQGVVCEGDCYSLEYDCGAGGTFDPSNCQCNCPTGTANCFDSLSCQDLQSDPDNCGQCFNQCASGLCENGVCCVIVDGVCVPA